MFIAKNSDLIVLANESRETLEQQLRFIVYTSIEETEENYILVNGEYKTEAQALAIKKAEKQNENVTKAKATIQDGYVVYKNAQFETNTQTCSDLTSTMLIMQATGLESYDWLSRDDQIVPLTLADFNMLGGIIAQFKNIVWNVKYMNYKEQIEACTTIAEISEIEIDYDMEEIHSAMESNNEEEEE